MYLPSLIGSILSFRGNGIGQQELDIISEYLEKTLDVVISNSISQIYFELDDYDDYFGMSNFHIVISKKYGSDNMLLRKRFFDALNDDEKHIIYSILNKI